MTQPIPIANSAPDEPFLTGYDMSHLMTYLRLLDADAEGADWREVARIVLNLDAENDRAPSGSGKAILRERSG